MTGVEGADSCSQRIPLTSYPRPGPTERSGSSCCGAMEGEGGSGFPSIDRPHGGRAGRLLLEPEQEQSSHPSLNLPAIGRLMFLFKPEE